MFESNTNLDHQGCDNQGHTFGAELLITTTTTTASGKYGRLWRRSLYVGFFITLNKKTLSHQEPSLLSPPYTPLPQEPPAHESEKFNRSPSVQSRHVIDVHSDNEKEKEVDELELLRETVAQIVKGEDLNYLRRLGGVDQVLGRLGSNLEVINIIYTYPVSLKAF